MDVTGGHLRRRVGAVAALVSLALLPGCGTGDEGPSAASSTTASTGTFSTVALSTGPCVLGPPATEVTFVVGERLYAVPPDGGTPVCRAGAGEGSADPEWGGAADRVLLGGQVLLSDRAVLAATVEVVTLSRPTGKATLSIGQGDDALLNRTPLGQEPIDITFLEHTTEAIYHPAGRHVVAVGESDGEVGIYIATNNGINATPLVRGETTEPGGIHDLAFDHRGDLLFVAEHDGESHVHRLAMRTLELSDIHRSPNPITTLVVSPFADAVAWRSGRCDAEIRVRTISTRIPNHGPPVGWLPDGRVVISAGQACANVPGLTVWDVADGNPASRGLWDGPVEGAAVRAVLPPPPDAPPSAPANAAPA